LTGEASGPPPGFLRNLNAAPMANPSLSAEQALAAARPAGAGDLRSIAWPTAPAGEWSITFAGEDGPAAVKVADATGAVTPPAPPPPETTARLMRRIHDGTGTGPVWQTIIFVGGLVPAALAVTGAMMWLRGRRVRGSVRAAFAAENERAG
jgi:uncharacterized iron-regulated membrane protein